MGDAKLSARPRHHQQDPAALTAFKKKPPRPRERDRAPLPADTPLELWWQDEARGVQGSAHGVRLHLRAICPEKGKGAALVLPRCATSAMNAHLAEISHAVLILDGTGWHGAADLVVPDNVTLLTLPSRAPELNPVGNAWQFMRENWLGDRIFDSYEDILDQCCAASDTACTKLVLAATAPARPANPRRRGQGRAGLKQPFRGVIHTITPPFGSHDEEVRVG